MKKKALFLIHEINLEGKSCEEEQEIANVFATYFAVMSATTQYSDQLQKYKEPSETV